MSFYPTSLQKNDLIRVIAPSLSMAILSPDTMEYAQKRLQEMGFMLSFGKHVNEIDMLTSSSISTRIEDLHNAFTDTNVKAILTAIGGYNTNQLLEYIDWSLIKNNPKIICGYSDITILLNAIYAKTGLVTYYGPHFSTFGQKLLDHYTTDYFLQTLTQQKPCRLQPATTWSNDTWYLDQDNRTVRDNDGYWVIQKGSATGIVVGGHLGTFCLLQGTPYMPSLEGKIIIIEEDAELANPREFDRRLQSLLLQPGAENIAGIVIGRFEVAYGMTQELLRYIISTKKILKNKPVIANVDFGHTEPHCTLPIGGKIYMEANPDDKAITILFS